MKKLLEIESHPLNHHWIGTVDKHLSDATARRDRLRAELVKVGEQVFLALQHADNLLSFHDKCQVMGRDHRGAANQMKREKIPDNVRFSNMVTVYNLEYNNMDNMLLLFSPARPLYTAYHIFFTHELIHNKELERKSREMFDEVFPGLPRYELRVV